MDAERLYQIYLEAGSLRRVAQHDEVSVTPARVHQILTAAGYELRGLGRPKVAGPSRSYSVHLPSELHSRCLAAGPDAVRDVLERHLPV